MKKTDIIDTNRIVHVDLGKLSTGLALTFKGVTAVFESLGADTIPGFGTVSTVEGEEASTSTTGNTAEALSPETAEANTDKKTTKKSSKKDVKEAAVENSTDTANNVSDTAEATETAVEAAETTEANNTEAKAETTVEEPEKGAAAEESATAAGSAFTLNDIMKIAAQKMAKDAGVTEKIGALVKTYGVSTLKELPEAKFEAFMTDLTQI